jgi:hypothetical protein
MLMRNEKVRDHRNVVLGCTEVDVCKKKWVGE